MLHKHFMLSKSFCVNGLLRTLMKSICDSGSGFADKKTPQILSSFFVEEFFTVYEVYSYLFKILNIYFTYFNLGRRGQKKKSHAILIKACIYFRSFVQVKASYSSRL